MADLPAGATFGSLVHAVLEHADPQAPDLPPSCRPRRADQLRWWPVDVTAEALAEALLPLHAHPARPARARADPRRHRRCTTGSASSTSSSRWPEATSAAGRATSACATWRRCCAAHLPDGDPLLPYAARLEQPAARRPAAARLPVRLDRRGAPVPDGDGHRFVVVDYKTNRLGEPGRPVTAADYGPAELADAMLHSHYPLQALLYSVVLHRFLRWRLPGYDPAGAPRRRPLPLPARHVRAGDAAWPTATRPGCSAGAPPAALVAALSDLLDARRCDA